MSAGPTSKRVVGPYGEHYRDPATGEPRTRLTAEGRRVCAELVARHPHPVALLVRHHPHLYRALRARRVTHEEVGALCRAAVVRAVIRWNPTRSKLETCVWWALHGEAKHLLRRFLRHESREVPASDFGAPEDFAVPAPFATLEARPGPDPEAPALVARLLARLPRRQREILTALYFEGLRIDELAARLGRSRHLVYLTREAALTRLRGLAGVESPRESRERGRVVAALKGRRPQSAEALTKSTRLNKNRVREHLAHMTRAGRVVRVPVPGRGRSFVYALSLEGKA